MPIVWEPASKTKRHRASECRPPVEGIGLLAASPAAPTGAIWQCPSCGRFYIAHKLSPLLPGWDRIPAWWARRKMRHP